MRSPAVDAYLQTNSPSLSGALTSWCVLMNMKATFYAKRDIDDDEAEKFIDYFDDGRLAVHARASAIPARDARDLLDKTKLALLFFDEMVDAEEMYDTSAPVTAADASSLRAMLAAICADLERLAVPAASQDPSTAAEGVL